MIDPFELHGKWILVRNLRVFVSPGNGGSGSRTTLAYDGSWTGERWATQNAGAKSFPARQDAKEYLETNRGRMA